MIGDACASPGIGERQRTFSPLSMFQWTGAAALESTPDAWGPRNCGQLPAGQRTVESRIKRRIEVRMVSETSQKVQRNETDFRGGRVTRTGTVLSSPRPP